MNTATTYPESGRKEITAAKMVRIGSLISGVAGAAAVILTIFGLGDVRSQLMNHIAIIALGIAFLFEGGAIATRFADFITETNKGRREVSKLGAGLTVEVVGGVTGGILGIIAILNVLPALLTPIAVIVFGVTLVFGSGVATWFDSLLIGRSGEHESYGKVAHEAVMASSGVQFILGMTAVVLGIMSLAGLSPIVMNLVALLCVGFAELLTGTALSARMWSIMLHTA